MQRESLSSNITNFNFHSPTPSDSMFGTSSKQQVLLRITLSLLASKCTKRAGTWSKSRPAAHSVTL